MNARGIPLAAHAVQMWGDTPSLVLAGGYPIQSWLGGVPHPALAWGGGGLPHPILEGCSTIRFWMEGTPSSPWGGTPSSPGPTSSPGWGYPIQSWLQLPHQDWVSPTWGWVHPGKDMGPVEVLWDRDGVPTERTWDQWRYYGMEMGYPCEQRDTCENSAFPILRVRP